LNGLDLLARSRGRWRYRCPCPAEIGGSFEVNAPARILGACGAQQIAVEELNGFVFDGAQDSIGQSGRIAPGLAHVCRGSEHTPPFARAWTDLVEEKQWTIGGLKEDWIPTGLPFAIGLDSVRHFHNFRPFPFNLARDPDSHIRRPLVLPAEPGTDQSTRRLRK